MLVFISWTFTTILFVLPLCIMFSHPLCVPTSLEDFILEDLVLYVPFMVMLMVSISLSRINALREKITELERYIKLLRADINDSSKKD
ncbi:MAG: hypothetical protein J6V41_07360 [Kiritimatiellae bacterium]|nr:hypothetical protein [Kiritimatiellia bacterium]